MKKFYLIFILGLLFLGSATESNAQVRYRLDTATATPTASPVAADDVEERVTTNIEGGFDKAIQALRRAEAKTGNPEFAERIRLMEERKAKVQDRVSTALKHMDERPKTLKLLIGPDYKNAGQLRSEIVQLRNEINQLQNLRERATTEEQTGIDESIAELETQEQELQTQLNTRLSGFSLFGWVARFLSGNQE